MTNISHIQLAALLTMVGFSTMLLGSLLFEGGLQLFWLGLALAELLMALYAITKSIDEEELKQLQ